MIYLIIAIFICPILMKTLQFSHINVKIILPTLITYSIWFLLSYLLILSRININYYLYFFYPFPFLLILYESFLLIKKRNDLKIGKFFNFLICFIIINFIINSFSTMYLPSDSISYMTWVINAYKTHSFIPSILYALNSFYYISTILGFYNIPLFFNTLSTYIIGIIFYVFLVSILEMRFKKLINIFAQIPIIILVVLSVNTYASLQLNWIIGTLLTIGSLFLIMKMFRNKDIRMNSLILDFLLLFTLNFSLSGVVVFLPILILSKIYITFKFKSFSSLWIFPILLTYGISYLGYKSKYMEFLVIVYIINLSFSIYAIMVFLKFKNYKEHKYKLNVLKDLFNKYENKKVKYIIINILTISYMILEFVVLVTKFNIDWYTVLMFLIFLTIFINILIYIKYYELLILVFLLFVTVWIYAFTSIYVSKFLFHIPSYLYQRVEYTMSSLMIFFFPILSLNFMMKLNKKRAIKISKIIICPLSLLPLFSVVNPRALGQLNVRFGYHVKKNHSIPKENYDLVLKYYNVIHGGEVFSKVEIPFNVVYFNNTLYTNGILLKPGQVPNISFFSWGSGYKEKVMKEINEMYKKVENTNFYNYIITINNTTLSREIQDRAEYKVLDQNSEITIWKLNQ